MRFFFVSNISSPLVTFDDETSKHITGVLRMKAGAELLLTDGQGTRAAAIIEDDHRKRCTVRILERTTEPKPTPNITIAISLIKNVSRFEWFLEKATEIGVSEIIPLICERTEKQSFRPDRMQGIITSAMLQSQQVWMPLLHGPTTFKKVVEERKDAVKFIAHCLPEQKTQLSSIIHHPSPIILIGPEGDFTPEEIETALSNGFQPVALGNNRLRTETAGVVAATLLSI